MSVGTERACIAHDKWTTEQRERCVVSRVGSWARLMGYAVRMQRGEKNGEARDAHGHHEFPLDVRRSGFATNNDGFGASPYTPCLPFFGRLEDDGGEGGGRACCSNASTLAATLPALAVVGLVLLGDSGVMAVGDCTRLAVAAAP